MASNGAGARQPSASGAHAVPPSPRPASAMEKLRSEFASLQQQLALLNGVKRPDGAAGAPSPAPPHPPSAPAFVSTSASQPAVLQPLAANTLQHASQAQHTHARHGSSMLSSSSASAAGEVAKAPPVPPIVAAASGNGPSFTPACTSGVAAGDITQDWLLLHGGGADSGAAALQALCSAAGGPGSTLGALAAELFGDLELTTLVTEGLGAQLQRSSDGATTQSRILELAGMCVALIVQRYVMLCAWQDCC